MNAASRRVTVIAHELLGYSPAGGMGTATSLLALALTRMGHSVEILLGLNDPEAMQARWRETYEAAGVAIRAMPAPDAHVEPWYFSQLRAVELGLGAHPPDVVVAHDFAAPAYSALRLRQAGLAFEDTLFIVFCHGTRRYVLDLLRTAAVPDLEHVLAIGALEQRAVELADAVVSPSAYLVEWMRAEGWSLPGETHVIPYFTRSQVGDEPLETLEHRDGEPLRRLTFFGRIDERKGLKLFASALEAVDTTLLTGLEVEFVGRTTATWPAARAEALLGAQTKRAVANVSFTGELSQADALERLMRRGTLVVMPSLQENSPNAIYECLEHEIPFVATNVGGVPELIAPEDRARVLCEPTIEALASTLQRVLAEGVVPAPARPAFDREAPFGRWAEVLALRPARRSRHGETDVDVARLRSGEPPKLPVGTAPFVLFAGEDDVLDERAVETLAHAQRASGADVVTCGIRIETGGRDTLHFFSGEPDGLGTLANDYGSAALVRRDLLEAESPIAYVERDPLWALLARLSAAGARIVSVPTPLVVRPSEPGALEDDSVDALVAVQELEHALPRAARSAARLAAGLAANNTPRVSASPRSYATAAAVVLLTALAAAARFSTLGRQSYWYDELATVSLLHRSFGGMVHGVVRSEATPYLYYVLAWPWTRMFGFGEAGLRSLSALAGTLTVPVTYAAGARLVSRRVGVIAAALIAVNPFLVWYSQEARAYALFTLLTAATLYFLAVALDGSRLGFVGWSLTAALAVATHYFAAFVVAAEAFVLLLRSRRRALAAIALPLVVALAEVPLLVKQRHNGGNLSASPLLHRVVGIPKDLLVGYSFPAELPGTACAAILVVVALIFVCTRTRARRAYTAGAIAAFIVVAPIAVAAGGFDYVIARNVIPTAVPAAIFLAVGYASRRAGALAAVLLCALSLTIVGAVAADTRYGRTDWRGAARALGTAGAPRAIVVTPTIDNVLWHPYLPGLSEPATPTLRVAEIDVVGLATQGGFSFSAVHPPQTPPRAAPPGFRIAAIRRTPTIALVRYRASKPRPVSDTMLEALRLSPLPGTVFLQGAGRPRR